LQAAKFFHTYPLFQKKREVFPQTKESQKGAVDIQYRQEFSFDDALIMVKHHFALAIPGEKHYFLPDFGN